MTYILDGLYLGALDDVWDKHRLQNKLGISHILTVNSKPLEMEAHEGYKYKYIHALDMDLQDLLSHFDESNQFIVAGRTSGGVLVHCQAGISRSATLVIAYLMNKMGLSVREALKITKKQRPEISPNHGFLTQLNLYESIGCVLDTTNKKYKAYKLEYLAFQMQNVNAALPAGSLTADPSQASLVSEVSYKCRKCRRTLFRASSLMPHNEGSGEDAFSRPWLASSNEKEVECTQSRFIEPVEWMRSQILCLEGKLSCPKCSAKLGSFNWSGEPCSCGTWVIPAFHIAANKLDECRPRVLPHSVVPLPKKMSATPEAKSVTPTTDGTDKLSISDHGS